MVRSPSNGVIGKHGAVIAGRFRKKKKEHLSGAPKWDETISYEIQGSDY